MFSTQSDNYTQFVHIFDITFLFAAKLEEPKIGIWGTGLTLYEMTNFQDWSNFKTFADNKKTVTYKQKFFLGLVENIVGKEKMLVTSISSFSHNVFKRLLYQGR